MWPLIEIALQASPARTRTGSGRPLDRLSVQDVTLPVRIDRDTGRLLLGGQSEEQLERTLSALTQNERAIPGTLPVLIKLPAASPLPPCPA
jgi:hypothetical protein